MLASWLSLLVHNTQTEGLSVPRYCDCSFVIFFLGEVLLRSGAWLSSCLSDESQVGILRQQVWVSFSFLTTRLLKETKLQGEYAEGRSFKNSLGALTKKGRERKRKGKESTKRERRPSQSGKLLGIGRQDAWSKRAKTPFTARQHDELGQMRGTFLGAASMEGFKRARAPTSAKTSGAPFNLVYPSMHVSFYASACNFTIFRIAY